MSSTFTYIQEFNDGGAHRLVRSDGACTKWAAYTNWTFLDDRVGITDYYTGCGDMIISPLELAALGIGLLANSEQQAGM